MWKLPSLPHSLVIIHGTSFWFGEMKRHVQCFLLTKLQSQVLHSAPSLQKQNSFHYTNAGFAQLVPVPISKTDQISWWTQSSYDTTAVENRKCNYAICLDVNIPQWEYLAATPCF